MLSPEINMIWSSIFDLANCKTETNNKYWGMHESHVIFSSNLAGYENPEQSIGI